MPAVARHLEEEQRRVWAVYAARLQGLEGAEYDHAEADAWDELQRQLGALGASSDTPDLRAV